MNAKSAVYVLLLCGLLLVTVVPIAFIMLVNQLHSVDLRAGIYCGVVAGIGHTCLLRIVVNEVDVRIKKLKSAVELIEDSNEPS